MLSGAKFLNENYSGFGARSMLINPSPHTFHSATSPPSVFNSVKADGGFPKKLPAERSPW